MRMAGHVDAEETSDVLRQRVLREHGEDLVPVVREVAHVVVDVLSACPAFTRFLSALVRLSQVLLRPIKLMLVVVAAWTASLVSLNHG